MEITGISTSEIFISNYNKYQLPAAIFTILLSVIFAYTAVLDTQDWITLTVVSVCLFVLGGRNLFWRYQNVIINREAGIISVEEKSVFNKLQKKIPINDVKGIKLRHCPIAKMGEQYELICICNADVSSILFSDTDWNFDKEIIPVASKIASFLNTPLQIADW